MDEKSKSEIEFINEKELDFLGGANNMLEAIGKVCGNLRTCGWNKQVCPKLEKCDWNQIKLASK